MRWQITNAETGEVVSLSRDVRDKHPQWVHDQLGTEDECELQHYLDQIDVSWFWDSNGKYKGADVDGIDYIEIADD